MLSYLHQYTCDVALESRYDNTIFDYILPYKSKRHIIIICVFTVHRVNSETSSYQLRHVLTRKIVEILSNKLMDVLKSGHKFSYV